MPVISVRDATRLEPASGRRREPDARSKPCQARECRTPHRALGEIGSSLTCALVGRAGPSCAQLPSDVGQASHATRASSLVVDRDAGDIRVAREQRCPRRRRHDVHWTSQRKLGDERRREDDVAEERGLDDEGEMTVCHPERSSIVILSEAKDPQVAC